MIAAVMKKNLKEFLRDRVVLFFTFAVPIFFLLVMPIMWGDVPEETISSLKGSLSLTMITFLIMIAGQSDLAGSIASDGERGLYLKIASMPVKPRKEGLGRVFGILTFSLIGSILLLIVGLIYGAKFDCDFVNILKALGFFLLIALASTGIGLIIASLVKGESAATHAGVAITLLTAFLGGMFAPYSMLPSFLQVFARIYPISSANASIVFLLEGEEFAYYNPPGLGQIGLTIALSCLLFALGLTLYSKLCWRKE